jgi:hypothetical protein
MQPFAAGEPDPTPGIQHTTLDWPTGAPRKVQLQHRLLTICGDAMMVDIVIAARMMVNFMMVKLTHFIDPYHTAVLSILLDR